MRLGRVRRDGWSMALSRRLSLPGVENVCDPSVAHVCRAADVAGVSGLCKSGSGLGSGGSKELSSASTCSRAPYQ